MSDKMLKIRAWLDADDEHRERERELPKALCRTCGGWAKAGEGTRDDEPVSGMVTTPDNPEKAVIRQKFTTPSGSDSWRRECAACSNASIGRVVSAVSGATVNDDDAARVIGRLRESDELGFPVPVMFTAQAAGIGMGKPWGHVNNDIRHTVREVLAGVIRERQIGPCTRGACGMCGVRSHLRWFEGPKLLRWPDGSPAPVRGTCQKVIDRRLEPASIEKLRVVGVECATGYSQAFYEAPPEFRLYAESKYADGNGHANAWSYSPALAEFIDETLTENPHLAGDLRDVYAVRLQARIDAQRHEDHQKREAAESSAW